MSNGTLRSKKKQATRTALAETAFALAMERGVDAFVIEDIVNKAGYSRRTFANHFSCKEEAIASALTIGDFQEAYASCSLEGLTPLGTIERFIKRRFTLTKLRRLQDLIALSNGHATLKLHVTGTLKKIQDESRQKIRDAFGDRYTDEYYYLLIGAVFGALMPVLDGSIPIRLPEGESDHDQADEFAAYMNTVFTELRRGFQ
jgi:AcrR family transcriptional regulator